MKASTDTQVTVSDSPLTTYDISEIDPSSVPSAILAELVEEIRNEELNPVVTGGYNRTYNRHNR